MDIEQILRFFGVTGGPALLGALVIRALWNADEIIKAESRPIFGSSSRSFWAAELRRFDYFKIIFDRVFATKRFGRPSLVRFLLISPTMIAVVGSLLWLLQPIYLEQDLRALGAPHILLGVPAAIIANLVFLTPPNIVLDYAAVWMSRALMALLGRSLWVVPIVLVLSLLGNAFLWLIGWGALYAVFNSNYLVTDIARGFYENVFVNGLLWNDIKHAWNAFVRGEVTEVNPGVWSLAVSLICAAISSLWLWLYSASLFFLGALNALAYPIRPLLAHLDFETTPIRINGILVGSILILTGVGLAAFDSIVG